MIIIRRKLKKLFYKLYTKRWHTIVLKNKDFANINDLINFLKNINTGKIGKNNIYFRLIKNAADPFLFKEKVFYEKLNWPFTKGYIESSDIIETKNIPRTYLKDFPHTSFPTIYKNKSNLLQIIKKIKQNSKNYHLKVLNIN